MRESVGADVARINWITGEPLMNRMRIAIADDHPLVLFALRELLEGNKMFTIVAEVSGSTELVEHLSGPRPADLVITDYAMPGDPTYGDGLRLIGGLVRRFPQTRFVVLTMITNPTIISMLYDLGVMAVVQKSHGVHDVVAALQAAYDGRRYYPETPGANPAAHSASVRDRMASLTLKELEVLRHFMRGESMGQVAANLKRSVKTVSSQKISAMRKLGLDSDQALVAFCIESGLFQ
uniref:response regulator n=1 Tax=Castellaniella defragrans TaxID=75697 RepID=UPI0033412751